MSATPANTKATAMVEIPLDQIEPSPWNRKQFNQQRLEELARTIVEMNGNFQPIVLRPLKGKGNVQFQIVAGERRWLATKIAVDKMGFPRKTISSTVREMTDAQAIKLTLMENHHREDLSVLERCRTYKFLLSQTDDATGKPFTRESIAKQIEVSYSVVCDILNADKAIAEVQEVANEGRLGSSHVQEIAKYTPEQQARILSFCFGGMSPKEIHKEKGVECSVPVRELRSWIGEEIHIDLTKAPFDTKDAFLLKGVPACINCLKRTGSDPGLFAEAQEVKKGDTCTDPSCYKAKCDALVQIKFAEAQRAQEPPAAPAKAPVPIPGGVKPLGAGYSQSAALAAANAGVVKKNGPADPATTPAPVIEVQKISSLQSYHIRGEKQKGVLYEDEYNLSKPGCKKEKKAIWVDGAKIASVVFICDVKSCTNHGFSGGGSGGQRDPITFERKQEIWGQKVQYVYRDELLKLIATKLPGKIGDQEMGFLAEHVLKTLPHRDHAKVARVLGLKDEDPESLLLSVRKMKPEGIARFLVVASLVEDLGSDGLAFGGPLDKESPLKIAAKAYRVDDDKLLTAAKAQLEPKRPKSEAERAKAEQAKVNEWAGVEKIAKKRVGKPLDAPKKKTKQVDHVKQAQARANKAKQKTKKKK